MELGGVVSQRIRRRSRRGRLAGADWRRGVAAAKPVRRRMLEGMILVVVVAGLAMLAHVIPQAAPGESTGVIREHGSIPSPWGAYTLEPSSTGPATYSVDISPQRRYGGSRGNVAFDFPAAGLSFQSSDIHHVSSRGGLALIEGTGRVDGREGHAFALTVGSGEAASSIRMQIWEDAATTSPSPMWLIYDNQ